MGILKVKDYLDFKNQMSIFIQVGKTHMFNNGIDTVHFGFDGELSKTEIACARIIADRDIHYGNELIVLKKDNYKDIAIDLRVPGIARTIFDQFDPSKLTPEFSLALVVSED